MITGLLRDLAHIKRSDTAYVSQLCGNCGVLNAQNGLVHLIKTHEAQKLEKKRQFLNG